jgi:hypothetical protein
MAEIISYQKVRLRRFSKEMTEIVDEIVKIERKWLLGVTTVEDARTDLLMVEECINTLIKRAEELNLFKENDLIKFRFKNTKAKIQRALRGEWGE